MNYFAHARPFLDDPYFVAGSGVPDMLMVVDRGLKVREKHVRPFMYNGDPITASVAGGIFRHISDDRIFHKTPVFAEISQSLAIQFRDAFGDKSDMRPRFLGHLTAELLLDAAIIEDDPRQLEKYYAAMESLDADMVEGAVNRMAPRSTDRLSYMISGICRERFLWDYLNDAKLTVRINQVMRRVGLDPLPEVFETFLPAARRTVADKKRQLLKGTSVYPMFFDN